MSSVFLNLNQGLCDSHQALTYPDFIVHISVLLKLKDLGNWFCRKKGSWPTLPNYLKVEYRLEQSKWQLQQLTFVWCSPEQPLHFATVRSGCLALFYPSWPISSLVFLLKIFIKRIFKKTTGETVSESS